MTPPPIDVQAVHAQLALHARSLKALAKSLIGDEHLADDVVQESFARTLAARPRPGPLGGWLATLVRNLARNERRTRLRAAERELRAVRTDLAPAPDDVVARRESLRNVVDAVLSLDEPYQTTILLRYFDELSPSQIAARTGASVATVKSRLARGLERLRRQLDHSHGERSKWTRALAIAVGIRLETPAAALAAGAIGMGISAKLTLAAAAVAVACMLAWKASNREVQSAIVDAPGNVALAVEPASAPPPSPLWNSERASIGAEESGATDDDAALFSTDLEHPYAFDLLVTVLDDMGVAIKNATIYLAPEHCSINRWPVTTAGDGTVRIGWRGKLASMEIALLAHSNGVASPMRRLHVVSGAPQLVTLGGEPDRGMANEVAVGVALSSGAHRLEYGFRNETELVVELAARQRDAFGSTPEAKALLHPRARFGDALLRSRPEPVDPQVQERQEQTIAILRSRIESMSFDMNVEFTRRIVLPELRMPIGISGGIDFERAAVSPPALEGVVLGEDGAPAKGVPVSCGTAIDGASERTFTDDDGAFRFDPVASDWIEVRAGGSDGGVACARMFARQNETLRWDARLDRGLAIRGRALDGEGKPLAGWRIEAEAAGWYDRCVVREDGTFELPNQPGGIETLLLSPGESEAGLPLWIEHGVLPESGEIAVRLGAHGGVAGAISVMLLAPSEFADVEGEVRVWQEESGRGAFLQRDDDTRRFSIAHLPAGWYRVEASAAPCGWIDLGRHWIDGEGALDLGPVALPEPAHVHIVRDPTQLPEDSNELECQLYARRGDLDVRCEDVSIALESEIALPAGDYWLLWRDREKARRKLAFSVKAGETLEVDASQSERLDAPAKRH